MVRCRIVDDHTRPVAGFFFCAPVRSATTTSAPYLHVYAKLCMIMRTWVQGRGRP